MIAPVEMRPGQTIRSAVSDVQVVVVKAPSTEVDVACGGVPMRGGEDAAPAATPDGPLAEGPALGKRYVDDETGLELLCSRPGDGALTVEGRVLVVKGAKPLPASD